LVWRLIVERSAGIGDRAMMALVPPVGGALHRLLGHTVRFSEVHAEAWGPRAPRSENLIYAFWHSSLLMASFHYRNLGVVGLISYSKDGELLARVVEPLGYVLVRGSTSRGSLQALRGLVRHLRDGRDVALTPDGPRGPREVAQEGTIHLARLTGKRIVPLVFDCTRKRRLHSWDRLIVPMPFSRGVFVYRDPIEVPRDADAAEIEAKRKLLEGELHEATRRAAEWVRGV
jgi:lysophospholipid acyltransferase (LPLAT)-like uncharacterized protein